MTARPISVSIVAWLLIVSGTIGLATMTFMVVDINAIVTSNPVAAQELRGRALLPLEVLYVVFLLGAAIVPIAGIAMLNQQNWGRWLYVVGNPTAAAIGVVVWGASATMIPSVVIFIVTTFFLFRPIANAYFSDAPTARGALVTDVERRPLPFV
jgi:hypothetical protein